MTKPKFADTIWAFQDAQCAFEEEIEEAGLIQGTHYSKIGWDHYDVSIEFYNVDDDVRLTPEQQRIIFGAGFCTIYVNHKDGWETHYSSFHPDRPCPVRGWRRYIEHNAEPGPSGVTDFKIMKISHWPDNWSGTRLEADLAEGRIVIVPDPLEPNAHTSAQ